MGVKIKDLIHSQTVEFSYLNNKVMAVDAFNMLYQFITTIRQPDGSPLTDDQGRPTSHLIGMFYRLSNLMKEGLKLVFVFDGKTPELKSEERERRKALKVDAQKKYDDAKDADDIEGMKKYAGRTSVLTSEIIAEAKELLVALGIPIIQAPSEGEAQAAHLVKKGDAYAILSQDADTLLFGAPRIVRNLSISQRRKKTSKLGYDKVLPELISLKDVLNGLEIDQKQLIMLGILVGTDYNVGGIKGIGPKNALKLVKEYKDNYIEMFKSVEWDNHFEHSWEEVYSLFEKPDVVDDYVLEWKNVDKMAVRSILVEKHSFSTERVDSVLKEIADSDKIKQKGLADFF